MGSASLIMQHRVVPLVTACLCCFMSTAHAETKLALRDCIDIALRNQPAIRAAQESLSAGRGRVTQARSPYFPQVTASTGYSESHAAGGAFGESVTKSYATTLSLNQLIYDFGRTGNALDAAQAGLRSTEWDMDRVVQEVVMNVKQAYYGLLKAEKLLTVAQKTRDQAESHLKQAQAFFKAGSKPRFDVTQAEVEVNSAKLDVINAENNLRLSKIALNNAMGVPHGAAIEIEDVLGAPVEAPTLDQAQADALKNRPELLRAEADIQSAEARVKAARSDYLPTISANGSYSWTHGTTDIGTFEGVPLIGNIGNSWNAGVTLSVPLFEGWMTRGKVSEAQANLLVLEAQRDSQKQSILLEVNQAYADLESASARVNVMESSLQKARENLDLAQGRYKAGIGPYIEVTDAQVAEVKAETDHVQALYDYQLAVARLFKAMGLGKE